MRSQVGLLAISTKLKELLEALQLKEEDLRDTRDPFITTSVNYFITLKPSSEGQLIKDLEQAKEIIHKLVAVASLEKFEHLEYCDQIYDMIIDIVKAYPLNDKDEDGVLLDPLSAEKISPDCSLALSTGHLHDKDGASLFLEYYRIKKESPDHKKLLTKDISALCHFCSSSEEQLRGLLVELLGKDPRQEVVGFSSAPPVSSNPSKKPAPMIADEVDRNHKMTPDDGCMKTLEDIKTLLESFYTKFYVFREEPLEFTAKLEYGELIELIEHSIQESYFCINEYVSDRIKKQKQITLDDIRMVQFHTRQLVAFCPKALNGLHAHVDELFWSFLKSASESLESIECKLVYTNDEKSLESKEHLLSRFKAFNWLVGLAPLNEDDSNYYLQKHLQEEFRLYFTESERNDFIGLLHRISSVLKVSLEERVFPAPEYIQILIKSLVRYAVKITPVAALLCALTGLKRSLEESNSLTYLTVVAAPARQTSIPVDLSFLLAEEKKPATPRGEFLKPQPAEVPTQRGSCSVDFFSMPAKQPVCPLRTQFNKLVTDLNEYIEKKGENSPKGIGATTLKNDLLSLQKRDKSLEGLRDELQRKLGDPKQREKNGLFSCTFRSELHGYYKQAVDLMNHKEIGELMEGFASTQVSQGVVRR